MKTKHLLLSFWCLFLFSLSLFEVKAQPYFPPQPIDNDPHRSLTVDGFVRFYNQSPNAGQARINPDHSILATDLNNDGIYEKEVALVKFCNDNHITHISLYDLFRVFSPWASGNEITSWDQNSGTYKTLREHLCRFIGYARANGISEIAFSGSGQLESIINSSALRQPTPAFTFTPQELANPFISPKLLYVTDSTNNGDPRTEYVKYILRALGFGGCPTCSTWFDYVDFEDEWWNNHDPGYFYNEVAPVLEDIYNAQQAYNSTHTLHPINIEVYASNFNCDAQNQDQHSVASFLDGCATCNRDSLEYCRIAAGTGVPRIANRINLTYYRQLIYPSDYSTIDTSRYSALKNSVTNPHTRIAPFLNAEDREWGGFQDFLGGFFRGVYPETTVPYSNHIRNIFNVELYMYLGYLTAEVDSNITLPSQNIVYPGGNTWFAASQMCGKIFDPDPVLTNFPNLRNRRLDNPVIFIIDESATPTAAIRIRYYGPIEQASSFQVLLYDSTMSSVVCTLVAPQPTQILSTGNSNFPNTFNINLGSLPCNLIAGSHYIAEASVTYSNGVVYRQREHFDVVAGTSFVKAIKILNDPDLYVANPQTDDVNGKDTITVCEGQIVTLAARTNTIWWRKDGQLFSNSSQQGNTPYLVVTESGTYDVVDTLGFSTNRITVNFLRNPRAKIVATGTGNGNIPVTLSVVNLGDGATAHSQYNWSTGETTQSIIAAAGDYTSAPHYHVTITQDSGCIRTEKITFPLDTSGNLAMYFDSLVTISDSTFDDDCATNNVFEGAAVFTTYTPNTGNMQAFITPGNGEIFISSTINSTFTFDSLEAGNYVFHLILDSYGSDFDYPHPFTIGNNGTAYTLNPVITQATACLYNNGAINLTGHITPAVYDSLVWSPTGDTTRLINNLTEGSYRVDIYNGGCPSFQTFNINAPANPLVVKRARVTSLTCANSGKISINNTPQGWGYEGGATPYDVYITGPVIDSVINTPNAAAFTGLLAGNYTLKVKDNNGCSDSIIVHVGDIIPVMATVVQTPSGCSGNLVDIVINACGGGGPYIYELNGATSPDTNRFHNLATGNYILEVTDTNGCTFTDTVVIVTPTHLSATIVTGNVCTGDTNGVATTIATGGTPPYSFSWNTGDSIYQITNLLSGFYIDTVTDANGCVVIASDSVRTDSPIIINYTSVPVCNNAGSLGMINLSPTGGEAPYTYFWYPMGLTTEYLTGLNPGTYSVQVTDTFGCSAQISIQVIDTICCGVYPDILTQADFDLGSPTITGNFNLNTSVVIDTASHITISGANIAIAPGVSITIQSNASLLIDSASHLFACDDMWRGIVVESNGILSINHGSIIEDAQFGARLADGAHLNAYNSTFQRNFVSIYVPPHTLLQGVSIGVGDCTFDCSTPLTTPYAGQTPTPASHSLTGIMIFNEMLNIGTNTVNRNIFKNMQNGILAYSSILYLEKCRFENMHPVAASTFSYSGSGVYGFNSNVYQKGFGFGSTSADASVYDCKYGIYLQQSNCRVSQNRIELTESGVRAVNCANRNINIDNNYIMPETNSGIELLFNGGALGLNVFNNTIEGTAGGGNFQYGIYVAEGNQANNNSNIHSNSIYLHQYGVNGIVMNGANDYNVSYNDVTMGDDRHNIEGIAQHSCFNNTLSCNGVHGSSLIADSLSTQIGMRSFFSDQCTWTCNTVDSTLYGVHFRGPNANTGFSLTNFYSHFEGLHLDSTAIIGQQTHTGNRWFGSYGSTFGARNFGIVPQSQFLVNSNEPNVLPNVDPPSWFFPNTGAQSKDCPNYWGVNNNFCGYMESPPVSEDDDGGITALDLQIAAGDIPVSEYSEETNYMIDASLYRKLNDNPQLISNTILENFYYDAATSNIGLQGGIMNSIESIYAVSQNLTSLLNEIDSTITFYVDSMAVNDSIYAMTHDSTIIQGNPYIKATVYFLDGMRETILADLDSLKNAHAQEIVIDNSNITPTTLMQNNEKRVDHYLMNKIAQDDLEFTPNEQAEILSIASQCPLSGGKAVFVAQGIYRLIHEEYVFDYTVVCAAEGYYRKAHTKPSIHSLSYIKPNPSSDRAVLFYNNINENNLKVMVYNAMNEILYSTTLDPNQFEHSFDVGGFTNGIYYYTIVSEVKTVSNGKFAVIK